MAKNKDKTNPLWGGRFGEGASSLTQSYTASIDIDKRLYEEDILGSIVHTQMLVKQKIINRKKGIKIINGVRKIKNQKNYIPDWRFYRHDWRSIRKK